MFRHKCARFASARTAARDARLTYMPLLAVTGQYRELPSSRCSSCLTTPTPTETRPLYPHHWIVPLGEQSLARLKILPKPLHDARHSPQNDIGIRPTAHDHRAAMEIYYGARTTLYAISDLIDCIAHLSRSVSHAHHAAGIRLREISLDNEARMRDDYVARFQSLYHFVKNQGDEFLHHLRQYLLALELTLVHKAILDEKSYSVWASAIVFKAKSSICLQDAIERRQYLRNVKLESQPGLGNLIRRMATDSYTAFIEIDREIARGADSLKQLTLLQNNLLGHAMTGLVFAPFEDVLRQMENNHLALRRDLHMMAESTLPGLVVDNRFSPLLKNIESDLRDVELAILQLQSRSMLKNQAIHKSGILIPYAHDIRGRSLDLFKFGLARRYIRSVQNLASSSYKPSPWCTDLYLRYRRRGLDGTIPKCLHPRSRHWVHRISARSERKRKICERNVTQLIAPREANIPLHTNTKHFQPQVQTSTSTGYENIEVPPQNRNLTAGRAFTVPGLGGMTMSEGLGPRQPCTASGKSRSPGQPRVNFTPLIRPSSLHWPALRFMNTTPLQAPQQTSAFMDSQTSSQCPGNGEASNVPDQVAENDPLINIADFESKTSTFIGLENTLQDQHSTMLPTPDITSVSHDVENSNVTDVEMDIAESIDEEDIDEEVEEHIPLSFQIPPDVLRTAMQAVPDSPGSFWSQTLYRGPENQMLLVHYSRTKELSERIAKYFLQEKVLGFDIEWKPNQRNSSIKDNVSLIQIACENRIALFHIAQHTGTTTEQLLAPTLKAIIESPDIMKVGVAVKSDFSRMRKYMGINPKGVFEISRLHNQVVHFGTAQETSWRLVSLARQVKQHLLLPLFKGSAGNDDAEEEQGVRTSDWSAVLKKEQIEYAASDAYAGLRLFDALEAKRKKLRPIPLRPPVCDSDNGSRNRNKPFKPVGDVAVGSPAAAGAQEAGEGAKEGMEQNEGEDMHEQIYATAAENFTEGEEVSADDSTSGPESTSSGVDSDPDADYIPPMRAFDQLSLDPEQQQLRRLGRRIGRVSLPPSLSSSGNPEIEYPKLPTLSSDEASSDSSDAIDPPAQRRQRKFKASTPVQAPPPEQDTDMSDPEGPSSDPLALATAWATAYLQETVPGPGSSTPPRVRATLSPLRAYHMWHVQQLPLQRIASLLRQPPLAITSVCSYIEKATELEKLDYDEARMKKVVAKLPAVLKLLRAKRAGLRVEAEAE